MLEVWCHRSLACCSGCDRMDASHDCAFCRPASLSEMLEARQVQQTQDMRSVLHNWRSVVIVTIASSGSSLIVFPCSAANTAVTGEIVRASGGFQE